jgi:6-phospho-beta-glucosidase
MYVLLLFQALADANLLGAFSRITLFGRDRVRLAFLAKAGNGYTSAAGVACAVDFATDFAVCAARRYDIVFNQIRFGGLASRDLDERTAIECGFAADETLGMVGVSNAVRTILGIEPYLEALRASGHRPRWINFTNPCSIVTQHLVETYDASAIGICDYPEVFRRRIADFLGTAPERLAMDYFGLNHFAFVHGLRVDGVDVLPRMLADSAGFALASDAQRYLDYLVVPSWDMALDPSAMIERQRAARNRAGVLLDIEQECQRLLDAGESDPAVFLALQAQRDCAWYALAVVPLLAACTGSAPVEQVVNLAVGDVFGSGDELTVVETNAMVDSRRTRAFNLPEAVRRSPLFESCRGMKRGERDLRRAILERDLRRVVASCMLNPMIRAPGRAADYLARLCEIDGAFATHFRRTTP